MSGKKINYSKLNINDEEDLSPSAPPLESSSSSISNSSTSNPSTSNPTSSNSDTISSTILLKDHITIRILYKEKQHNLINIPINSTILYLKNKLLNIIDIPINRMRFIISGKAIKEDNILLSSLLPSSELSYQYYYQDKDKQPLLIMHLFPLPSNPLPPSPPQSSTTTTTTTSTTNTSSNIQPFHITSTTTNPRVYVMNLEDRSTNTTTGSSSSDNDHDDERIMTTVRMWCFILLFLSMLSIFNNFSFFISTGKISNATNSTVKILDIFLFLLDFFASFCGIYAASAGIKSLRTMSREDVEEYLRWLICSSIFSFFLRIIWVFDVVLTVKYMIKDEQNDEQNDNNNDEYNNNNDNNNEDTSSDNTILEDSLYSYTLQAIFIGIIILMCWASCLQRAYNFYSIILNRNYNEINEENRRLGRDQIIIRRSTYQELLGIFFNTSSSSSSSSNSSSTSSTTTTNINNNQQRINSETTINPMISQV